MSAHKNRIAVRVRPGFLLLLALLFYLGDDNKMMLLTVLAAAAHEGGHIVASRMMKGRVEQLTLSMVGAELTFEYPIVLSYGRENLVLLSGAAANLLIGGIFFACGFYQVTFVMVVLGTFNLLPVIPLDGGRILSNFLSIYFEPDRAIKVVTLISAVVTGILTGIGVVWLVCYANVIPLILSVWLLLGLVKD